TEYLSITVRQPSLSFLFEARTTNQKSATKMGSIYGTWSGQSSARNVVKRAIKITEPIVAKTTTLDKLSAKI
ncbi:MAG: hypothetical protein QXF53_01625, partial [Candidatus Bathyarchaeia archaeon]